MMTGNDLSNGGGNTGADEGRLTRRDLIRDAGRAAAAPAAATAATLATAAGVASASHAEAKPDHVLEPDGEAPELERYSPLLDLRDVPADNRPSLLGWWIQSPDRDLDVAVYAAEYAVQRGVISLTSHSGDHEWIYVFVDSDTGEIDHVSYAAYHWLRGYVLDPYLDPDTAGDHPVFRVANRYHNYIPLNTTPDTAVRLDVDSLGNYSSRTGALYGWLDNGLEQDLAPGAVHNPWLLSSTGPLDSWWSDDTSMVNRLMVSVWAQIGFGFGVDIRGSAQADPGDASL